MTVKAKLLVVLKADEVEVAASEDAALWQQILVAITSGRPLAAPAERPGRGNAGQESMGDAPPRRNASGNDPASRMAAALDIDLNVLIGACAPQADAPFITLDIHRYEAMRKALPARGSKAVPNISLAGTLLGLWFHYANLGHVSQAQAQAVLDPLGQRDNNPGRGIGNTEWLQTRAGGQFSINPAEISKATTIARCFCTKDWTSYLNNQ
jgi:hypothetical protein